MKKQTILVLGCDGMLGHTLFQRLIAETNKNKSKIKQVIGIDIKDNIAIQEDNVFSNWLDTNDMKFDWCINCIAMTDTKYAQTPAGEKLSLQLNVLAPRNIAKACNEHKIKLIHISTDYVFGGVKCRNADELYDISDLTAPAGTYGTHKHLGELEIMKYMHKHDYAIMRTSWLYGTHKQKSFIHKFLKNAALNHAIKMTSNEYSVPTSVAYVISEILSCIIDKPKTNLIHCVPYADRGVSRFQFANEVLDILKDEKIITEDFVKMDPVMLDADNVNFPLMSAMKTTNTNACSWKDDLHSYIRMHKYEFAFYLEQFNSEKKEN